MNEEKKISINGKEFSVVFNVQTIINFEEIADKSFFGNSFSHLLDRISLVVGAVLAADEKSDIKVEDVMKDVDAKKIQEILEAYTIVMNLAEVFFKIPKVEPEEKHSDENNADDKKKN